MRQHERFCTDSMHSSLCRKHKHFACCAALDGHLSLGLYKMRTGIPINTRGWRVQLIGVHTGRKHLLSLPVSTVQFQAQRRVTQH